jgi:hypothetical protein
VSETLWAVNPAGAITTIEPSHPAYGFAKDRKEGWREASEKEIAEWASGQIPSTLSKLRERASANKQPAPSVKDEAEAIADFYAHQGISAPKAAKKAAEESEAEEPAKRGPGRPSKAAAEGS